MITSYATNDVRQAKAVKVFQKILSDNEKRIGLLSDVENSFHLGDNNATVIATLGKSSVERNQLLNLLIDRPVFGIPTINLNRYGEKQSKNVTSKIGTFIEAFHDTTSNTIYLNFTSTLDKTMILDFLNNEGENIYDLIIKEEYLEFQCILFLFLVSNIILILQSTLSIDMEWISLFKLLGNLKETIQTDLQSFITKSFFNSSTITADILGNQYCPGNNIPIVLCVFNVKSFPKYDHRKERGSKKDFLFQLHSSLEHQVKGVLKKCKNNGCKNLYTIDSQCALVVILGNDINQNTYDLLLGESSTHYETDKFNGIKQLRNWIHQKHKSFTQKIPDQQFIYNKGKERYVKASSLENQHVLLSSRAWFTIAEKVKYYLLEEIIENAINIKGMSSTNIDYLFSRECCLDAKNIAKSIYLHDLPENCTEEIHQKRMKKALKVYKSLARGVASREYERELVNELEKNLNT